MKKKIQMNEETRKNIISAFLALYEKKNTNKISVVEIIEKAGYNRSTFYYYFKNTQDILNYIEDDIINSLIIILNNHKYEYELTPSYANDLINFYQTHDKKINSLLTKHGDSNLLLKLSKEIKNVFYKNHIKDSTEYAKFEIIYSFISSAFIGSFVDWYTSKNPLSINEFLELAFKLSNTLLNSDKNINLSNNI